MSENMSLRRLGALVGGAVLTLLTLVLTPQLFEVLDAKEVMVIQSMGGDLNCFTDPGPKWQGLGTVTTYPRRGTYSFDKHDEKNDTGKALQFNDGGKAVLYGSVNWEMPLDCKQIVAIHKTFGSAAGIEAQGVSRMVNSAVYLSGPMMSSIESAAEKRSQLVELINDQAQRGVYQTVIRSVEQPDPITNEKRHISIVEIVRDSAGLPRRQQGSILEQYGIHLQPMSIEKLLYSQEVTAQIAERQKATQAVQLSQANARKAQQDAITAEENGKAEAAKAKWAQETIKAKLVTEAQQKLEVATLAAKEAEQFKREQILRGEGEAERRRLVMSADGALDQKLQTYKDVMTVWAQQFGQFKGTLVPQVQMGAGAAGGTNAMTSTQSLIDMLSAKTARDLAVDLSNVKK